jgi:hypothetical protein
MNYLSMKENWNQLHYLIYSFWFFLKQKLQLRQGLKLFKKIQKDINIISNLFLNFFVRLTWHYSCYNHIPIHYNHEIINGWFMVCMGDGVEDRFMLAHDKTNGW